jgi:hypothetical protein
VGLELSKASAIGHPVSWLFYTLVILHDNKIIKGM